MKKRILALFIITLMLMTANTFTALADDGLIMPLWDNIAEVDGIISYDTVNNTATVGIAVDCEVDVTRITATATLYYKTPTNRWIKIETEWGEYDINDDLLVICETFDTVPGREYKVVLEATTYSPQYTESVTKNIY